MAKKHPDIKLPPETDRRLDRLLAEWAEHVAADLAPMEQSLPEIIVIAEDMGYDWWRQLFDRFPLNGAGAYPLWPLHEDQFSA
ncbi:hypothetical protein SD70_27480 [Gordoniibacillus kamchatkensis]|uniref:Uncharacterized protein n=1 Tax=Gordoniibacillus kamchatkensis TaxID=1590651 RepID=A0ABR5AC66_9BACL|nr:hypothetical protein [Paenibacillus sp. VKM B-2647]KIL38268.1 hypothetical protein SD70_27480 [Paenibacillus sp. VKM B-2647]